MDLFQKAMEVASFSCDSGDNRQKHRNNQGHLDEDSFRRMMGGHAKRAPFRRATRTCPHTALAGSLNWRGFPGRAGPVGAWTEDIATPLGFVVKRFANGTVDLS